jgi:outer membrane receptor protein involved in Fe transport
MKRWYGALSFWAILVQISWAQNTDSLQLPKVEQLPVIVISNQRAESDLASTPAAISKVWPYLERRSTPEMLAATPGVFVQKTNHGGGSPFLRGLTGNQTLLLLDGIRLSNATFRYGPNQYLNTIDPFSIGNMEVWKGGGSVAYGSDAMGGTINVLSKQPYFSSEQGRLLAGGVKTLWRSQDMEKTARAEGHYAGKKMGLVGGMTYRQFGDLVGGDTTGKQSPSGYNELAFDLKGKFLIAENSVLTLAHQFFRQNDVPVYHKIQLEGYEKNHMALQRRQLSYARLEAKPAADFFKKITATVSLHQTAEHRDIQKNGSAILRREEDDVNSLGASVQAESKFSEAWRATFGLESYHDRIGSARTDSDAGTNTRTDKRGLYPDGATFTSAAAFWLNKWEVGKWGWSGGLRYNYFSIRVEDETLGKVHLTPGAFVWNAALLRHLGKKDKLFFDFNTGFRAPNVDDLGSLGIVDFRYEVPTADLKPEKSYNYELGWRHRSERWQAEAFLFRNELRDLIARVRVGNDSIASYPVYRKENKQKGYVQGFEASAGFLLVKHFRLEGALAWQYGQNVTDGEPLRRIPPTFGRVALNFSKNTSGHQIARNEWYATLELLAAAKQDRLAAGDKSDNRIPEGGTPGWKVVNFFGSWKRDWLRLRAGCWNIFNEDYRYHGSGINGMGRSVSVGAEVWF